MQFYKQPEILDRSKHAKLRFTPLSGYQFADKVSSVPIVAVEFPLICRRYPIGFIEDAEGGVHAQAILSVVDGTNSFVGPEGQWLATYVPAFIRRYPFIMANIPNDKTRFAIAIDTQSGGFADDKGTALFEENGESGALLKGQVEFLSRFHADHQRTAALLKNLKDEGLLVPLNLDITRGSDKARFGVRGLLAVDEKKLQSLSAEKAQAFLASGLLAIVYMHLISLRNFEGLANRSGNESNETIPWWAK